jgi:hypothetical protein
MTIRKMTKKERKRFGEACLDHPLRNLFGHKLADFKWPSPDEAAERAKYMCGRCNIEIEKGGLLHAYVLFGDTDAITVTQFCNTCMLYIETCKSSGQEAFKSYSKAMNGEYKRL